MTDLLETLRALAPVVTPGPQQGSVTEQLAAKAAIRRVCTEHLPTIIAALKVADQWGDYVLETTPARAAQVMG